MGTSFPPVPDLRRALTLSASEQAQVLANLGQVLVVKTGDYTLSAADSGRVLRVESASAVTVTVPNGLPELFEIGLIRWGAGTVSVAAGAGATNRSGAASLSRQYGFASLCVARNSGGAAAEYLLGGDVS